MKAMILAAGRGERMRPLTDSTPKPLLQAGGRPLIVWHLQRLKQVGIDEIVINHAWLGQQIEDTLGDGSAYGVHLSYSAEGAQGLETAGGIATALPFLGDKPFLVVNGDVFTDIDFQAAQNIAQTLPENQLAYLWLVPNPEHHPNGDFSLQHNGLILSESTTGQRGTFSGVGIYRPELFANIAPRSIAKLAPLLRQAMQNQQISGTFHQGLWLDVGTPERLQQAHQLAQQGKLAA